MVSICFFTQWRFIMLNAVASDMNGTDYDRPTNVRSSTGSEVGGCGGMITGKGVIGTPNDAVTHCPEDQKLDTVSVSRYNSDVFGSTVLDNGSADKVESSLPFAKNNNRPVGTKVPGVLQNAANYPALTRSIHYMQTCAAGTCTQGVRTYQLASAFRANRYNRFTGAFSTPVVNSTDPMGPDAAAVPTRDVPGTLTYMPLFNGVPKTTNYVAKT
jgi:hypothetical protein